jgi:2-oxoglutarate ferredoxin oxidoreductase subunit delta
VCPKNVLEFGHDGKATPARPQDCIQCEMCEMMCPDLAITVATRAKAAGAAKEGGSGGN